MARRSRVAFVRPAPRTMIWIGSSVVATTVIASGDQLLTSLSAGALLLRPFTLIRTRIRIWYESDQAGASERTAIIYGRIVVKDQARVAGVGSLPKPDLDPDASWFVYEGMQDSFVFGDATGFVPISNTVVDIDSRAMRKVGINEDVVSVVSEVGAFGGVIKVTGRTLIKLH